MLPPKDDLVQYQTAKELTEQWAKFETRLRAALAELVACEKDMEPHFGHLYIEGAIRHHGGLSDADRVMEQLELQGWAHILSHLGVWQFLSVGRANQLRTQLEGKSTPLGPLTLENVSQMMHQLYKQIPNFAEEAVMEVFNFLRPDTHHKTNSPWELKAKVILERAVEPIDKRWPTSWRPHIGFNRRADMIGAIDRVFHLLDGCGYVSKTTGGKLGVAINESTKENPTGSTQYFKFKAFQNGNLHLEILRPDLIFKFNQIAGKQFLGKGNTA